MFVHKGQIGLSSTDERRRRDLGIKAGLEWLGVFHPFDNTNVGGHRNHLVGGDADVLARAVGITQKNRVHDAK